MASETENTLLSQLPAFSRIVTPDATIYIKQGDGIWYRWANFKYDCAIQLGQFLPTGTQAFHMQDDSPRYVKYCHDWLTTRPDRAVFVTNSPANSHKALGHRVKRKLGTNLRANPSSWKMDARLPCGSQIHLPQHTSPPYCANRAIKFQWPNSLYVVSE